MNTTDTRLVAGERLGWWARFRCRSRNHARHGQVSKWRDEETTTSGVKRTGPWVCAWCGDPAPDTQYVRRLFGRGPWRLLLVVAAGFSVLVRLAAGEAWRALDAFVIFALWAEPWWGTLHEEPKP